MSTNSDIKWGDLSDDHGRQHYGSEPHYTSMGSGGSSQLSLKGR